MIPSFNFLPAPPTAATPFNVAEENLGGIAAATRDDETRSFSSSLAAGSVFNSSLTTHVSTASSSTAAVAAAAVTILVAGQSGCGKSTLIISFISNSSSPSSSTISSTSCTTNSCHSTLVQIRPNLKPINAILLESSSPSSENTTIHSPAHVLNENYFISNLNSNNFGGALLVFDLGNRSSFQLLPVLIAKLKKGRQQQQQNLGGDESSSDVDLVILIVGNKNDLYQNNHGNNDNCPSMETNATPAARMITRKEAENFAIQNGCIYYETSAIEQDNVDLAFTSLVSLVFNASNKMPRTPYLAADLSLTTNTLTTPNRASYPSPQSSIFEEDLPLAAPASPTLSTASDTIEEEDDVDEKMDDNNVHENQISNIEEEESTLPPPLPRSSLFGNISTTFDFNDEMMLDFTQPMVGDLEMEDLNFLNSSNEQMLDISSGAASSSSSSSSLHNNIPFFSDNRSPPIPPTRRIPRISSIPTISLWDRTIDLLDWLIPASPSDEDDFFSDNDEGKTHYQKRRKRSSRFTNSRLAKGVSNPNPTTTTTAAPGTFSSEKHFLGSVRQLQTAPFVPRSTSLELKRGTTLPSSSSSSSRKPANFEFSFESLLKTTLTIGPGNSKGTLTSLIDYVPTSTLQSPTATPRTSSLDPILAQRVESLSLKQGLKRSASTLRK